MASVLGMLARVTNVLNLLSRLNSFRWIRRNAAGKAPTARLP